MKTPTATRATASLDMAALSSHCGRERASNRAPTTTLFLSHSWDLLRNVDLTLADRTFVCPFCGHTEDRDVNAAKNLRTLAQRGTNARGELQALVFDGIIRHQPTRRNVNPGARKRAKKEQGILSPILGV